MIKKFFKAFVALTLTIVATIPAFAQDSIQYQLVIRNAAGKLITNKQVNMKFSLVNGGQSFYEETQKTTTDKYGNINVFIGTGTAVKGAMKDVPWSTMDISLKVESDTDGGNNFKELGTVPIAAAPYAMFAATAGSNANGGSPKDGEALFEVCDRDGQPVFAVYNSGIVVYVDESNPKAKRSGLVVTGRSSKDGESADYFAVDAEGTHIYVDDADETAKAKRSGLVVTGRSASKSASTDEKYKTDDRTATKTDGVDVFTVSGGLTTVYVDDTDNAKAARSGFVVTGRTASKDGEIIDIDGKRTNLVTEELTIGGSAEETPEPQPGEEPELVQNKNHFAISSGQVQVNADLTMIGDVEKKVEAEIIEPEIVFEPILVSDNEYNVTIVENLQQYLETDNFALMAIYGDDSYVPVKLTDGDYRILFDESGFITKQHDKAAVLMVLNSKEQVLYIRPLKPMHKTISFGLMDANNTSAPYSFVKLTANIDATEGMPFVLAETEHGTVSVKGDFFYGETVELTPKADNGYVFGGWGDNQSFENPRTYTIPFKYTPLKANFYEPKLYVKDSENGGRSSNSGFSQDNALSSIEEAVGCIINCNPQNPNLDWTINVVGDITGAQKIENPAGGGIIPVRSIKITGDGTNALCGPLDEDEPEAPESSYSVLTINNKIPAINSSIPVIIENLTIKNGYAEYGGGIYIVAGGKVTLGKDAKVCDNVGTKFGGGIYVGDYAELYMTGGLIKDNYSGEYGGGIFASEASTLYMTGGVIDGNSTYGYGGGIFGGDGAWVVVGGNAVIGNTEITDASEIEFSNEETETRFNLGSGIYVSWGSNLYIGYKLKDGATEITAANLEKDPESSVVIQGNASEAESGSGGGVYFSGYGTFKMYNTTVACNRAHRSIGSGSGICLENASGTNNEIDKCQIRDNYSDYGGGAGLFVYNNGSSSNLTVSNTDFYNNKTTDGGGAILVFKNGSTLELNNCKIYNNEATTWNGGGIFVDRGSATANNCQIYGNTAKSGNGVAAYSGNFTISGSTTLAEDNDVHLTNCSVTVDNLTGTSPVATITPDVYSNNPTVLSGSLTQEIIGRFGVTPKVDETTGDITRYYIDAEGKLQHYTALRFRNVEGKETLYLIPNQTIEIPDLADYEENGITHHFAGWYFHNPQTKQYAVLDNTTVVTDDIDVYAFWNAEIDVPQTGISTIADAVGRMCNRYCDYRIKISGTLGGSHTILKTDDVEIAAASITLEGEGSDAAVNVKSNNMFYSTALTINTAVPVEIKNLTITGGEVAGNGGGLRISSISTVTLADGAIISGNKCTGDSDVTGLGGGVYNEGTLFIYGSVVIGDGAAETTAGGATDCSNTARRGGGLYNAEGAHAYLGYKSETEEAELTGGIYYNYTSSEGGGVYNKGTLVVNSGNIAFNRARTYAGGVYTTDAGSHFKLSGTGTINNNICQAYAQETQYGGGVRVCEGSTFEMTGGEISNNEADWGGGLSVVHDGTTFTMTGGVIRDNTARGGSSHGALNESGTFNMGKHAVFEGNNDIRLKVNKVITITEAFDSDIDCAATISLESYEENQVLGGNVNSEVAGKFSLSNNEYYINELGVIKKYIHVSDLSGQSAPNAGDYPLLAISTEAELIQLATWVNGSANSNQVLRGITFKLVADIELTNAFTAPIGTGYGTSSDGKAFWGIFDGNGHTISGLNTSNYTTTTSYPALFGNVAGTIKNLTVSGSSTSGGIAGCLSYGLIENCISNVEMNIKISSDAGGMAASGRGGTIRQCTNNGKITSDYGYIGGIVGYGSVSSLIIDGCVNNGEITGSACVGGIVGSMFGTVRNCANTQSVTGSGSAVGGIAGNCSNNSGDNICSISNCYNKGNVKGTKKVGGIAGEVAIPKKGNVRNCYNAGSVAATIGGGTAGGVIGEFSNSAGTLEIESNYYLTGTATTGIGGTVPEVVTEPTAFEATPASLSDLLNDLNTWLGTGNNNSGNIYKSWTIKEGGDGYPEFAE